MVANSQSRDIGKSQAFRFKRFGVPSYRGLTIYQYCPGVPYHSYSTTYPENPVLIDKARKAKFQNPSRLVRGLGPVCVGFGALRLGLGALGSERPAWTDVERPSPTNQSLKPTWRFMGNFKWGYK